jgi:CDP-diacylglycerol--serine O-phosphatidyltransferase
MQLKRFLRYLAPNLVTFASLTFGMSSIVATFEHRFVDAAWFVMFSVLTDKLDGFVARLVKGTSEFGVQLDSFADFLNFGIAPATLFYVYLVPGSEGGDRVLVTGASALWVLAVTFRLARFNVLSDDPRWKRIFFGVPTTLMGGVLCALFATLLKYGADFSGSPILATDDPRLLGGLHVPSSVWRYWPFLEILGALLMASAVKIPKLGLSKSKVLSVIIVINVFGGYACGATRHLPEYLTAGAATWILGAIVWGFFNTDVRHLRPPPIFPREDRPASQLPQRPEEDLVPEEEGEEGYAGASTPEHKPQGV